MPDQLEPFDPQHIGARAILRFVGPAMAVVGTLFMIMGLVDFFSAFGGMHQPDKFWCLFVGMPLLGIGLSISKFAYMGAIARYMADEVAPVGKDVVNYMGDGTTGTVRNLAAAVGEGFRSGMPHDQESAESSTPQVKVRCQKCHALNDESAKFCSQCGAPL